MATKQNNKQGLASKQVRKQTNGKVSGTSKHFTVEMKELIADVSASSSFTPQQIEINPGLPGSFPWLSQIAGAYEKYKIKQMSFEIMPQCPATTVGGSGMYIDYDANDGTVTTKGDFFAMSGAQVQQIWQSVYLNVITSQREYFVRNSPVSDSKLLYDHCNFNYFVESDSTSPNVLIFVHYTIEFIKPQVNMNAVPYVTSVVGSWSSVATTTDSATLDGLTGLISAPLGKVQVPATGDYLVVAYIANDSVSLGITMTVFGTSFGSYDTNPSETGGTRARRLSLTAGVDYTAFSSSATLGGADVNIQLIAV